MTGPEKRFFLDHLGEDHAIHRALYKALQSKGKGGEEAIRADLFIGKKRGYYSVVKSELKELIMESLRKFNAKNSIHAKISNALSNTEILYGKGLLPECEKELKKAMKMIEQYDYGHKFFEAAYWYKRVMFMKGYSEKTEKLVDGLHEQELYYTRKIASETSYQMLSERIYHIANSKGYVSDKLTKERMRNYFNDPLLQDESLAVSHSARSQFYNLKTKEAELNGDAVSLAKWNGRLLLMLEESPEFRRSHSLTYVHTLYNQTMALIAIGRKDGAKEMVESMRSDDLVKRKGLSGKMKRPLEVFALNAIFSYGLAFLEFEQINTVIDEQGEDLLQSTQPNYVFVYTETYYLICVALIVQSRYKEAIRWVNKVLDAGEVDQRIDLLSSIRIANLVIHFELHNDIYLQYNLESVARYLRKHQELKAKEQLVVKFIRTLVNVSREPARQRKLREIYEEYKTYQGYLDNLLQFTYLDIELWMRSKIENRSFLELSKEMLTLRLAKP